jgi:hypothetical protein
LQQSVDDLDAVGQVPMSLIRWELTGEQSPELAALLPASSPNFQSVFVDTRLVQPRTASVRLTRYFSESGEPGAWRPRTMTACRDVVD